MGIDLNKYIQWGRGGPEGWNRWRQWATAKKLLNFRLAARAYRNMNMATEKAAEIYQQNILCE